MHSALARELDVLLQEPRLAPMYAGALEVASGMLRAVEVGQVTATTVVGALGTDDVDAFKSLVGDIGAEYGLETRVRMYPGSYSVRFARPATQN